MAARRGRPRPQMESLRAQSRRLRWVARRRPRRRCTRPAARKTGRDKPPSPRSSPCNPWSSLPPRAFFFEAPALTARLELLERLKTLAQGVWALNTGQRDQSVAPSGSIYLTNDIRRIESEMGNAAPPLMERAGRAATLTARLELLERLKTLAQGVWALNTGQRDQSVAPSGSIYLTNDIRRIESPD